MHTLLQDVLRRSCDEKAPEDLHRSIHEQLLRQAQGAGVTEVVTQYSMTEISIEIDEFGHVEHREIQIEQTHIERYEDSCRNNWCSWLFCIDGAPWRHLSSNGNF
jgi:hypothetical protein